MREQRPEAVSGPIVVCIDTYENEVPSGCFYHANLEQGAKFSGLIPLLKGLEEMMNCVRSPQNFMALRSFEEKETQEPLFSAMEPCHGTRATFVVNVLFRQNASWQGKLTWLEGEREEAFRSVLELLFLMDNALKTA